MVRKLYVHSISFTEAKHLNSEICYCCTAWTGVLGSIQGYTKDDTTVTQKDMFWKFQRSRSYKVKLFISPHSQSISHTLSFYNLEHIVL